MLSNDSDRERSRPDARSGAHARPAPAGGQQFSSLKLPLVFLGRRKTVAICLLLFVLVLWGFLPSLRNDFVNYDDNVYVTENLQVQAGLTWESLAWAFGKFHGEQTYWHPLTWVSHMLDCRLYGLQPWGHHLTSVLWHAVNTLLVFLVFKRLTGAVWRCAVLAALFALHPLQVDTVAWVTERKNLLSTSFFLLTVWAYARYAELHSPKSKVQSPKSEVGSHVPQTTDHATRFTIHISRFTFHAGTFYLLSLLFFALGLMCKPAVVTLPFVLLLLDYWPLRRFPPAASKPGWAALALLVWEKAPLFLLAAASSGITLAAHHALGMFAAGSELPWDIRIENALISYCRYLGKVCYPLRLCVLYPHPQEWPLLSVLLASLLLLGVSVLAATQWKRRPYLAVGWLWFLGTLVPVIGLVQVGAQAMADRFMYVPLIGLLLLLIWGMHDLTSRWRHQTVALTAAGAAAAVACLVLTRSQVAYWKDSESLFRHAIAITENNHLAHNNLGLALANKGLFDQAVAQYRESLKLKPDYPEAHNNLGITLAQEGLFDEATGQFQQALKLKPGLAEALNNLGLALARQGRLDEAIDQFQEALKLNPGFARALYNLGNALLRKGQKDEAMAHFQRAVEIDPKLAKAQSDLGNLLLQNGRVNEALAHYQRALELQPANAFFLNNLAWVLATCPNPQVRNGRRAIELAQEADQLIGGKNPAILSTLAAAYAESGRFPEAVATAQRALDLATAQTNSAQADILPANIALYRAGAPFHDTPRTNFTLHANQP